MTERKVLTLVTSNPTARKQPRVVVEPNSIRWDAGQVILAIFAGFAVGLAGGFFSSRLLRLL
jgi:hypothetical protein